MVVVLLFKWQKALLVDAFQTLSDVVIRCDSPLSTPAKHAFENIGFENIGWFHTLNTEYFM